MPAANHRRLRSLAIAGTLLTVIALVATYRVVTDPVATVGDKILAGGSVVVFGAMALYAMRGMRLSERATQNEA